MPTIYADKSELPERREHDFYPTPRGLVRAALDRLNDLKFGLAGYKRILDPGAGLGVWGQEIRKLVPDSNITGIEIQKIERPDGYDRWITDDYLLYDTDEEYDLILGNPPYKFAQEWVEKSFSLLSRAGILYLLYRIDFLAGQHRYKTLFSNGYTPTTVFFSSRRPSFTGNKKTAGDNYAMFLWEKSERDWPGFYSSWFMWDYLDVS